MNSLPIEAIKQGVDIVKVIGQYVKLERHGQNFKGLCPFHNDNNPSMSVNINKQIFKCFSCNTGGDVLSFLTEYKHISLVDAIAELAPMANIKFTKNYNQKPVDAETAKILNINNLVMQYCANEIQTGINNPASKYLKTRNVSKNSQIKFKLGYCSGQNTLISFFNKKGYTLLDLQKAGIIAVNNNQTYSFLDQRLIFPITNENNAVVGFSARALNTNSKNKYINSRETTIFKKTELLYN